MAPGQKFDHGKLEMGNFFGQFPNALKGLCTVAQYGKIKYCEGNGNTNFKDVPEATTRYRNAITRHLVAYLAGEWLDPESLCPHLFHIMWNAAALIEVDKEGTVFDIAKALDKERIIALVKKQAQEHIKKQAIVIRKSEDGLHVCNEPSCEEFGNGLTPTCLKCDAIATFPYGNIP